MKRFVLLLCLFSPAWAADEDSQIQMLKKILGPPSHSAEAVLAENRQLLDASFFERIDTRIRWGQENNQLEDAIRFSGLGDKARKVMGQPGRYRVELVHAFLRSGNYTLAKDVLTNILFTDPEEPEAQFLVATILKDEGDLFDARTLFKRAAEAGFAVEECLYEIGRIDRIFNENADRHLIIHPYNPPGYPQPYLQFTGNPGGFRGGGGFAELPMVASMARVLFKLAR